MAETLERLRVAATGSRMAFNDHVHGCATCDRPPLCVYLCPAGQALEDDAQMWFGLKLRAEADVLRRPA